MKYNRTMIQKIVSAFTALLLLPLLLTCNGIKSPYERSFGQHSSPYNFSASDNPALPVIACSEELITKDTVRFLRSGTQRLPVHPEWFIYFFNGAIHLLTTALLLYVISLLMNENIVLISRYIIKYIHDQDGHKI